MKEREIEMSRRKTSRVRKQVREGDLNWFAWMRAREATTGAETELRARFEPFIQAKGSFAEIDRLKLWNRLGFESCEKINKDLPN